MSFNLEIVTPDREFFSEEVYMVIVRGEEGDLAVLKNRVPLITPLAIGHIKIYKTKDSEAEIAATVDGYVTITKEKTTIVTDAAEWPHEIDQERAEEARKRAENRLKSKDSGIDTMRAEIALKRAINRLKLL